MYTCMQIMLTDINVRLLPQGRITTNNKSNISNNIYVVYLLEPLWAKCKLSCRTSLPACKGGDLVLFRTWTPPVSVEKLLAEASEPK